MARLAGGSLAFSQREKKGENAVDLLVNCKFRALINSENDRNYLSSGNQVESTARWGSLEALNFNKDETCRALATRPLIYK